MHHLVSGVSWISHRDLNTWSTYRLIIMAATTLYIVQLDKLRDSSRTEVCSYHCKLRWGNNHNFSERWLMSGWCKFNQNRLWIKHTSWRDSRSILTMINSETRPPVTDVSTSWSQRAFSITRGMIGGWPLGTHGIRTPQSSKSRMLLQISVTKHSKNSLSLFLSRSVRKLVSFYRVSD